MRESSTAPGRRTAQGFTLIELMIVVAIIATLAAIALPKFGQMLRASNEGSTKGNLGALRSALSIYYGENTFYPSAGWSYPSSTILSDALVPKYMDSIPPVRDNQYHATGSNVMNYGDMWAIYDNYAGANNWQYDGYNCMTNFRWSFPPFAFSCDPDQDLGNIYVDCTHTDSKGTKWSAY